MSIHGRLMVWSTENDINEMKTDFLIIHLACGVCPQPKQT